jgi:hypothetical protein
MLELRAARHRSTQDYGRFARLGLGFAAGILALATVLDIGAQQPTAAHGLCLAIAAILLSMAFPRAPETATPLRLPRAAAGRRLYAGIGLTALGCLVAGSGAYSGYQSFDNLFYYGLALFVAGGLLIGAGLFLASNWHLRIAPARWLAVLRQHKLEALALAGILLLGIVLRLYQLGYYPPPYGFFLVDEPQIGAAASQFIHHGSYPWNYPELVYGAVLSFKIFGTSMLSLRYPVVLAGIILLCAFYPFARLFYCWPVALAGTTLLAVSRYEIAYTRLVLPACTMMVYEFVIFLLGALAIRGRAAYFNYAVMGLLVGLGMYSHTSFRLVPLLLILFWIGWLISARAHLPAIVRAHSLGWLLFLAVAMVTAPPYIGLVRADTHAFTERHTSIMPILFNQGSDIASNPGATLRTHAEQLAGYFIGPNEAALPVNPPGTSLLDPVTGTLFLLGLGYGLLHLRRPYILMLVTWFTLTVVTGGLLTLTVDGHRFIGALPTVFLLACLPLEVVWRAVRDWRPPAQGLTVAATLIGLAGAGWVNFDTMFNRLSHNGIVRQQFDGQDLEAIQYFAQHGRQSYNYLMGYFAIPTAGTDYAWMVPGLQGRNAVDLDDLLPLHDPLTGAQVHIVVTEPYPPAEVPRAIARIYPTARTDSWQSMDKSQTFSATTVDNAAIAAQQGLAGPCPVPLPCPSRPEPTVSGAAVHWTGSMYIPVRGTYRLSASLPSQGAQRPSIVHLDGKPLTSAIDLNPGWYDVDLESQGRVSPGAPSLGWAGPTGTGIVPAYDLRRTAAHGMLLLFPSPAAPTLSQVAPKRVPFPFFQAIAGPDSGWPSADATGQTYRALLSGIIAGGHAGTYTMQLRSFRGQTTVFLDNHVVGRGLGTPEEGSILTPISLHLTGRPQVLRIELETRVLPNTAVGAALFTDGPNGSASGFLPWEWLTPPSVWEPLPTWLPLSGTP